MENRGLLFIPDISGFSRFVHETEIGHSRLIIQELLEVLINANQLGLEVSEIEGDAILFYKFGEPPSLQDLYRQVEKMFCDFHRNLIAYDHRRYCQCKACLSAINLTLKVITHYGEFTGYNVKNFNKLIGKDIIVAHQLLKNDINHHEYWLVTRGLLVGNPPKDFTKWMQWSNSIKQTENGIVSFQYTPLSELKNQLPEDMPPQQHLANKDKLISLDREYATDIITLFHATGDFQYRNRWMEGVRRVEEVNHFLPRVGMRCRCLMDKGMVNIHSNSYQYRENRIEFSETDEQNKNSTHFILQKLGPGKSKLTLDFYLAGNLPKRLLFRLFRKAKVQNVMQKSLKNLDTLVKELKIPTVDLQ